MNNTIKTTKHLIIILSINNTIIIIIEILLNKIKVID